jgi:hypothetical protein
LIGGDDRSNTVDVTRYPVTGTENRSALAVSRWLRVVLPSQAKTRRYRLRRARRFGSFIGAGSGLAALRGEADAAAKALHNKRPESVEGARAGIPSHPSLPGRSPKKTGKSLAPA